MGIFKVDNAFDVILGIIFSNNQYISFTFVGGKAGYFFKVEHDLIESGQMGGVTRYSQSGVVCKHITDSRLRVVGEEKLGGGKGGKVDFEA